MHFLIAKHNGVNVYLTYFDTKICLMVIKTIRKARGGVFPIPATSMILDKSYFAAATISVRLQRPNADAVAGSSMLDDAHSPFIFQYMLLGIGMHELFISYREFDQFRFQFCFTIIGYGYCLNILIEHFHLVLLLLLLYCSVLYC